MKKIALLLLYIFTCGNLIFAQNELNEIEKLATTAKVWGFLKYYHPEVADGKKWWDLRRAGDDHVFQEVQYVNQAYQLLLPITADMIGRNPLLELTLGYWWNIYFELIS